MPARVASLSGLLAPALAGVRRGRAEAGRAAAARRDGRQAAASSRSSTTTSMSGASSRSNSVEIRARVSGYLDKVHFKDGQIVKQGDLLFTIDRRPFETALGAGARDARAGARQSGVRRERSRARLAARARPHHHGADVRAAHAGQARRGSLRRRAGGGGAAGRARSSVHRAEGAGHRPDRRPARVARAIS